MATAGIVAEYNPFHRGHAWHIARTRRTLGADTAVICVMSGHWVQRGECALTDKWSRAALALSGGADLVLELPTPWAMASAESFARGAVGLLAATGVVDVLSFVRRENWRPCGRRRRLWMVRTTRSGCGPGWPVGCPSRRPGRRRWGRTAWPAQTTTWGWSTCGPCLLAWRP